MKKIYVAPKMEQQQVACINMIAESLKGGGTITQKTYGDAKDRNSSQDEAAWNALW